MSPAKRAELIEMPFGTWTWVGRRKHVLDEVHIGETWQIRLNRPCSAVMRPFREIILTTSLLFLQFREI